MIRRCTDADVPTIHAIINDAAEAYRGVIPADCWHEPYMTRDHLRDELAAGVEFSGTFDGETLVGVMGLQKVLDATLIRHAYVRRSHQSKGIGAALLSTLAADVDGPCWSVPGPTRRGRSASMNAMASASSHPTRKTGCSLRYWTFLRVSVTRRSCWRASERRAK